MATGQHKMPTLRTIAQLSGLAVPTVSRALNDAPDIGQKTKERVRQIARDIGYVPNRAGVRLRTGKTNVVSLVLGTDNDVADHMGQLVSSVAGTLRSTRYHVVVTPYFPDEDPMIPVRFIVETGAADALILNRIEVDDPRVEYLMEKNIPFVTYGRSKWRDSHPYFDFDNEVFGRLGAETLVGAGRKFLTLLAPPQELNYSQDMIRGATKMLEAHGIKLNILPDITADDPGPDIQDKVAEYLTSCPDCDGMICPSTIAAMAATVGAERIGRRLGQDFDIFAREATPLMGYFRAPIGSVLEDMMMAGSFLANAAVQAIEKPELPPMQKLVSATPQ